MPIVAAYVCVYFARYDDDMKKEKKCRDRKLSALCLKCMCVFIQFKMYFPLNICQVKYFIGAHTNRQFNKCVLRYLYVMQDSSEGEVKENHL